MNLMQIFLFALELSDITVSQFAKQLSIETSKLHDILHKKSNNTKLALRVCEFIQSQLIKIQSDFQRETSEIIAPLKALALDGRQGVSKQEREKFSNLKGRVNFAWSCSGLTNDLLAKTIHKSTAALRSYKTGKATPDLATLDRIAEACKVNVLWLAFGKGPVFPELTTINQKHI